MLIHSLDDRCAVRQHWAVTKASSRPVIQSRMGEPPDLRAVIPQEKASRSQATPVFRNLGKTQLPSSQLKNTRPHKGRRFSTTAVWPSPTCPSRCACLADIAGTLGSSSGASLEASATPGNKRQKTAAAAAPQARCAERQQSVGKQLELILKPRSPAMHGELKRSSYAKLCQAMPSYAKALRRVGMHSNQTLPGASKLGCKSLSHPKCSFFHSH